MGISIRRAVAAALLSVGCATAASATSAFDYDVFVRHNFSGSYADVEGALAAGGNVTLNGYAIGAKLSSASDSQYTLVSGGAVGMTNTQVYHGKVMGTSVSAAGSAYSSSSPYSAAASPVDFASEFTRLIALSSDMAAHSTTYGTTGSVSTQYGQLFAVGSDAGVNVFNISGSQLNSINTLELLIPSTAIALFNVSGTSVTFGNFGYGASTNGAIAQPSFAYSSNYDASRVLFNFADATSLQVNGSIEGSVLAANAAFNGGFYHVNGQTIADTITGNDQFNAITLANTQNGTNLLRFNGQSVSAVPEPGSWGLMLSGFAFVGGALRLTRRRTHGIA